MTSTPERGPFRCSVSLPNEAALPQFAAACVATLPDDAFVALEGDLGAGKTTLVKAIAAAVGIDQSEVVSPTFGLIHLHDGPCPPAGGKPVRIVHADMYRLGDEAELRETGWEDAIAGRPGRRTWTFVEWPSRIARALPADRLDIMIRIDSETGRTFELASHAARYAPVIAALATQGPAAPRQSRR